VVNTDTVEYIQNLPKKAKKNNNSALFKGTTNIRKLSLIAQDQMKSMFYKIKCTAASDQVLNCQPKLL
jgi:hypothetical protein